MRNQENLRYFFTAYLGDYSDLGWISFYDYFNRIGIHQNKLFLELKELSKCGIFMSIQFEKVCFISKPPVFLKRDSEGNMHCDSDYAIYFKDGFGLHYLYGIYFSPEDFNKYIKDKKANGGDIIKLENAEQRAALIKLYGYERLINWFPNLKVRDMETVKGIDGKMKNHILYQFHFGKEDMKIQNTGDMTVYVGSTPLFRQDIVYCFLSLDDHSTNKKYYLGIPDTFHKVKDALAWTFQLEDGFEYKPILQS